MRPIRVVAFTPKGGCPLKPKTPVVVSQTKRCSIHPQGWVPIETLAGGSNPAKRCIVAFTPKGGCPLKPVAIRPCCMSFLIGSSIHPQGWVPIETGLRLHPSIRSLDSGSIHPQGWVPIETISSSYGKREWQSTVAFTPKGGCPLKPPDD